MKHVLSWIVGFVMLFGIASAFASTNVQVSDQGQSDTKTSVEQTIVPTTTQKKISVPSLDTSLSEQKKTTTPTTAPNGTYTNTAGNEVPSPYYSNSIPAGASARCGDGTYSFSQSRRGTCSHHGGVDQWL